MSDDMTIRIKLFGAFRRYGADITLTLPAGSSVTDIKAALAQQLEVPEKTLVADAVLANDTTILPDAYIFNKTCQLAILPPVCGG